MFGIFIFFLTFFSPLAFCRHPRLRLTHFFWIHKHGSRRLKGGAGHVKPDQIGVFRSRRLQSCSRCAAATRLLFHPLPVLSLSTRFITSMAFLSDCWFPEKYFGECLHLCGAHWLTSWLIIVEKRAEILLVFVFEAGIENSAGDDCVKRCLLTFTGPYSSDFACVPGISNPLFFFLSSATDSIFGFSRFHC